MDSAVSPLRPPDFIAMFAQGPHGDETPSGDTWHTVLSVQSHCWSARVRLIERIDGAGTMAEVWLCQRASALCMFPARTEFLAWQGGEIRRGYVMAVA
ncbi:hypothetical protein [Dyella sp. C11]|uniref:hypothetical protein n=1 Tax=Dyella sp. C11 TaxID=2126991 RepID=UPI000D64773A|nr:hypothetical protein [Dyella sp. C11]